MAVRLDKWLWAARLYKTRSLASEEVSLGRVQVNAQDVKPAREVRVGDRLQLRQGRVQRDLIVKGLSHQRGPAPVAQQLYEETPESIQTRTELAERMRLAPEPAAASVTITAVIITCTIISSLRLLIIEQQV